MKRGRKKGNPKTGGRKAGTPNKMTVQVKAALEQAFDKLGGVKSLVAWGKVNPDGFHLIWVKLLPKDINLGGSVTWEQIVEASRI